MSTRPEGVPEGAEELDLFQCMRTRREPSELCKGRVDKLTPELVCPNCEAVEPMPKSGTTICASCGISRHLWCGGVWAWRDPVIGAHERQPVREPQHA